MLFVPRHFDVKLNLLLKGINFMNKISICAYQNDGIKNFAVVMRAIVKRADCTLMPLIVRHPTIRTREIDRRLGPKVMKLFSC